MTFTIGTAYSLSKFKEKYSKKRYKDIMLSFFYELSKAIIYEKYTYKVPLGGGSIRIVKITGSTNKTLDYKYYKETGIKRFHLNRHTNGFYFKWHWFTRQCKYTNYKLYKMIPNRGNDRIIGTRGLARHIKDCSNDPYKKDYDVIELRWITP